jgi:hypothetical protein
MTVQTNVLAYLAQLPAHYEHDQAWAIKGYANAADRYTLLSPNVMTVNINGLGYVLGSQTEISLATAANWDTTTPTDYTVAANRAGKDFYVYACQPASGITPVILLSASSTFPAGYDADTSRKIAGFHCLCVAAGTIAGHALTGFAQGDILPQSIWNLKHRPASTNLEGMVYSSGLNKWIDIYLTSGTGSNTASVNGGTISDSRNWMTFVDDYAAVGKRMLTDFEFQCAAAGSNEETNINGSADPVTTTGHSDSAGRRMISNIGCEDCCGVVWQWLLDQSYRNDDTYSSTWEYYDLPGAKGSLYRQGDTGDVKLRAGGAWFGGSNCGSRARDACSYRWNTNSNLGGRGCAENVEK